MFSISSCTSQNSTAILSQNMDTTPSLTSSTSSASTFVAGGRALDRHNPIITDEKRSGGSSKPGTPIGTPRTHHILQQKPTTPKTLPKTPTFSPKTKKKQSNNKNSKKNPVAQPTRFIVDDVHHDHIRKSISRPSDMIMKAAAATCNVSRPGVDYISPPESSRYLLDDDDDDDTSFLEVFSDFEPVLKLAPNHININNHNSDKNNVVVDEFVEKISKFDDVPKLPTKSSSDESSDQVVVLRVSLHCRGCERKLKKHLSRLSGVTSFNIDLAAKKVTVIGDVTPLQVLASISKVKTAKLWTPPSTISSSSSAYMNTRIMEATK